METPLDGSVDVWDVLSEGFSDTSDMAPVDVQTLTFGHSSSDCDAKELSQYGLDSLRKLEGPLSEEQFSESGLSRSSNPHQKPHEKTRSGSSESSSVGSRTMDDSTDSSCNFGVPSPDEAPLVPESLSKDLTIAALRKDPALPSSRPGSSPITSDFRFAAVHSPASRPESRTSKIQSGRLAEVAENPFWSANVTPHCRASRSGSAQPDPVVCNGSTFAQVTSLASSCVQLMSHTLDMSPQVPIADSELTTIRMETKEQRLQWRDFLSDSVSQTRATSLFNSYDVEASPGYYARPPLSGTRADNEMKSWHGNAVGPHVVAPTGAGLVPLCREALRGTSHLQGPNVCDRTPFDELAVAGDMDLPPKLH
uniref:Uncharacterized protein n=1 Tax=Noctiluca scintillans TaxID=2966 RepID=A0A7S1A8R9_NOCSC|mmetsp:Transcript_36136/g.95968  ORF Transcript_36136/g.95968 Transcript_36136/m.95968 type:complete len:366 (+) Transcript_36136:120-1217(+)|eukprot:CAMPEP_0194491044 /NCGR_PEP_ID=MMETSP0253-20130528/10054_1 /TAXON_ID=2966 /ORGANISM="Noctiluca scintillans" /LENGTH=365 /DNA_ID=CAMNT_0039331731 /DNA_START=67 /DNA_END=1164 /DNA_ORIENTATION=+